MVIEQLTYSQLASSSAGGLISSFVSSAPSFASEWNSFTGLYEEYRVLAMSVTWVPYNKHWGTTAGLAQTQAPVVYFPVRNPGVTPPTSYNLALQFAGSKAAHTTDQWTVTCKMSNHPEADFVNVTAPAGYMGVGYFATGLSAGIGYAQIFVRLLVQFRSRD
jgi:hypothetical protein